MLALPAAAGLTPRTHLGKTDPVARSKHGMSTDQTETWRAPLPCAHDGPPVDVVAWRACRLREAGFPPALADSLARTHVDLHALLQLVDAGCPPRLAARILAPLEPDEVAG